MVESNIHIVSDPARALAKLYPKQAKAFDAKLAKAASGKNKKRAAAATELREMIAR